MNADFYIYNIIGVFPSGELVLKRYGRSSRIKVPKTQDLALRECGLKISNANNTLEVCTGYKDIRNKTHTIEGVFSNGDLAIRQDYSLSIRATARMSAAQFQEYLRTGVEPANTKHPWTK